MNDLDVALSASPSSTVAQAKREQVKLKIEAIKQHKARAAQVKARAHGHEKGEKNTKYFLNLEKSRANVKIIDSLINEAGQLVTNQKDIMKMQRDYYAKLYRKKMSDVNMMDKIYYFLGKTRTPHLSQEQTTGCEWHVLREEVLYALKQMKSGSAPGTDGITIEFIKMFRSRIGLLVISSFETAFKNGKLSSSQCKAVIILIHKGNELARNDLKNWRPISLTNSDYKLLAKCLALRLSSIIAEIINEDQVEYIKVRRASTLLRLIDDVIEQLNVQQKPGLLLTVDYSQAFDRISKIICCVFLRRKKKWFWSRHFTMAPCTDVQYKKLCEF